MPTIIRIKSDTLKREITVSSVQGQPGVWEMKASTMAPLRFTDNELSERVADLLKRQFNMTRDPNYVSPRAGMRPGQKADHGEIPFGDESKPAEEPKPMPVHSPETNSATPRKPKRQDDKPLVAAV